MGVESLCRRGGYFVAFDLPAAVLSREVSYAKKLAPVRRFLFDTSNKEKRTSSDIIQLSPTNK